MKKFNIYNKDYILYDGYEDFKENINLSINFKGHEEELLSSLQGVGVSDGSGLTAKYSGYKLGDENFVVPTITKEIYNEMKDDPQIQRLELMHDNIKLNVDMIAFRMGTDTNTHYYTVMGRNTIHDYYRTSTCNYMYTLNKGNTAGGYLKYLIPERHLEIFLLNKGIPIIPSCLYNRNYDYKKEPKNKFDYKDECYIGDHKYWDHECELGLCLRDKYVKVERLALNEEILNVIRYMRDEMYPEEDLKYIDVYRVSPKSPSIRYSLNNNA